MRCRPHDVIDLQEIIKILIQLFRVFQKKAIDKNLLIQYLSGLPSMLQV